MTNTMIILKSVNNDASGRVANYAIFHGVEADAIPLVFGEGSIENPDGLSVFSAPQFEAELNEQGSTTLMIVSGTFNIALCATVLDAIARGIEVKLVPVNGNVVDWPADVQPDVSNA